jgi:hypothetical protein
MLKTTSSEIASDVGQFLKGATGGSPSASANAHFTYQAPVTPVSTPDPGAGYTPTYAGSSGGSAGAAGDNPAALGAARNNIYGDTNLITQLYNALGGQLKDYGTDRRNSLTSAYNDKFAANDKDYASANNSTIGGYNARGLGDSSLLSTSLGDNKSAYDTNNKATQTGLDNDLATVSSTLAQNKAQIDAYAPQNYDLSQYGLDDLQSLHNELSDHINALRGSQANLQTGSQLRQQLDSLAPSTARLSDTLKPQIDKILAGGGDPSAKLGIANTYISKLPADQQSEYQRYLNEKITPLLTSQIA